MDIIHGSISVKTQISITNDIIGSIRIHGTTSSSEVTFLRSRSKISSSIVIVHLIKDRDYTSNIVFIIFYNMFNL